MSKCVFVDANKNIVRVEVVREPNGSLRIDTDRSKFWLYDILKPASESQDRFLKLLKKGDLEFLQERFKAKFIYAVEDIQTSVQKAEDKFLEALGERELWLTDVVKRKTELGFKDWCEHTCMKYSFAQLLDNHDMKGRFVIVDDERYWVGIR